MAGRVGSGRKILEIYFISAGKCALVSFLKFFLFVVHYAYTSRACYVC